MKKFNLITFLFVFLSLTACFDEETKTVEFYKTHDVERKKQIKKCRNNPGELTVTPNCINSTKAKNSIQVMATGGLEPIDVTGPFFPPKETK